MRILVTIPHYCHPGDDRPVHGSLARDPGPRLQAFAACVGALHHLFGEPQCLIDVSRRVTRPANAGLTGAVDVVVCTTRGHHLLADVPVAPALYRHHATGAEPPLLGFECHAVLRDHLGRYDYYCYLEDDLVLHDPWFFRKYAWFNGHLGDVRLLQPNRFEAGPHPFVRKAYVDGEQRAQATARFQDVRQARRLVSTVLGERVVFRRASNPHSGCFFLNARQMEHWSEQSYFLDRDTGYVGPLESAATLGILRAFQVYKPAPECASFLEVEHFGTAFLDKIRRAGSGGPAGPAR